MKKRLITLLTCAALLSTVLCSTAFAANSSTTDSNSMKDGFDTLSYSEEAYQALAETAGISESDQIKNLIVGYLASEKAYVRNPKAYTRATNFVDAKALGSKTIAYRESESEYLKELNNLMGWTISEDNISFSAFKVTVNQKTAQASICF